MLEGAGLPWEKTPMRPWAAGADQPPWDMHFHGGGSREGAAFPVALRHPAGLSRRHRQERASSIGGQPLVPPDTPEPGGGILLPGSGELQEPPAWEAAAAGLCAAPARRGGGELCLSWTRRLLRHLPKGRRGQRLTPWALRRPSWPCRRLKPHPVFLIFFKCVPFSTVSREPEHGKDPLQQLVFVQ